MSRKNELYVKKIENGTVIDHIPAGLALEVMKILGIDGRGGYIVSVAMNVPSKKYGKKDVLKVEGRELSQAEVNKIALIAPNATINIIRSYEVYEKNKVKLPKIINNIVKCGNPSCITNMREPVEPAFTVEQPEPLKIRCQYCNRLMEKTDVLKQF
ncbi:MAG: aspartate carbamoyltransferase regulatory subunit [Candidatus Bathyarchaeia archaeon]